MDTTEIVLPSPAQCTTASVSDEARADIISYLTALDRTPPFSWEHEEMWQDGETRMMEMRLQIHDDNTWSIHTGDPQYDQDHRGLWADTVVPFEGDPDGHTFDAEEVADSLIENLE